MSEVSTILLRAEGEIRKFWPRDFFAQRLWDWRRDLIVAGLVRSIDFNKFYLFGLSTYYRDFVAGDSQGFAQEFHQFGVGFAFFGGSGDSDFVGGFARGIFHYFGEFVFGAGRKDFYSEVSVFGEESIHFLKASNIIITKITNMMIFHSSGEITERLSWDLMTGNAVKM